MFGRKKKEEGVSSLSLNQDFQEPVNNIQDFQSQPVQNQPVNQPRFNRESYIIQGSMKEDGTYVYVVETNYPLSLGDCKLTN